MAEFAAHPQVDAQPKIAREMEEHLFTPGFGAKQLLAGQKLKQSRSVGVTEDTNFGPSDDCLADLLTKARIPLAAAVFDFGKFWHKGEV